MAHSLVKQLDHVVTSYIENQELHHRKVGLQEEFRRVALEQRLDPVDCGPFEK